MITRRRFVGRAVTTAIAGLLPASLARARPVDADVIKAPARRAKRRFYRGRRLGKKEFKALIDEVFYVYGGPAGVVDLRLTAVKDGPRSTGVEQFFLDFRGPSTPSLESGTHQAEHSRSARFEIYLQEAGGDGSASYYSASFSHLIYIAVFSY